jgi:hypothetical protein
VSAIQVFQRTVLGNAYAIVQSSLIQCDVIFGSPRLDCAGSGICKISEHALLASGRCHFAPAFAQRGERADTLVFLFPRELLCPHLMQHHFRKNILEVTDAVEVPAFLTEGLGLMGSLILPGRYAVAPLNGGYRLEIPLY